MSAYGLPNVRNARYSTSGCQQAKVVGEKGVAISNKRRCSSLYGLYENADISGWAFTAASDELTCDDAREPLQHECSTTFGLKRVMGNTILVLAIVKQCRRLQELSTSD